MANQVIVTNTGNVQVALTPPPNVQVQISRAAIGTVSNVPTANFANYAGNVTGANQPNITSVGVLSNLTSTGTATFGNVVVIGNLQVGNLVANSANFANFAGEAFNVSGSNVTGAVANATYSNAANTANLATFATTANAVAGANVSGIVANANYSAYANIAATANNVAVANVSGIGNIAVINLDGNASNVLFGNGTFGPESGNLNANYANFAGEAFNVNASNITGTVANANYSAYAGQANTANLATFATTANAVAGANVSGEVANAAYANAANTANLATYATTANSVAGANVSGTVANATFALDAGNSNLANTANSVALANVVGIGNIANINLDGNASNILFGNGTFSAIPVVSNVANANYANFAGTAFSVSGSNVSGEVANANFASYANLASTANLATFATTANSVAGANVSGEVANANYASYANIAASANSVALANVVGIGNIANINLDGSSSNVLFGNGVFAPESTSIANANYSNFAGTLINGTSNISIPTVSSNILISTAGNANIVDVWAQGTVTLNPPAQGPLNALRINTYGRSGNQGAQRISSFRFRGNSTTPLSVEPGDNTMEFLTVGYNGSNVQTNSVASIRAQVDSSYSANGANIPLGWQVLVNDTNAGITNQTKTHNFYSNGNVTFANSVFVTDSLSVTGNVTGSYIIGNGSSLSSLTGGNVTGAVAYATTANSVAGANVSGEVAFAAVANNVAGANVSGQVSNALVAGTVYTNAQPNITSTGNLVSLNVVDSANVTGTIQQLAPNTITITTNATTNTAYNLTTIYGETSNIAEPGQRAIIRSRGNVSSPSTSVVLDVGSRDRVYFYNGTTNAIGFSTSVILSNLNSNSNAYYTGASYNIATGNPNGDQGNVNANSAFNLMQLNQNGQLVLIPGANSSVGSMLSMTNYGQPASLSTAQGITMSRARGNRDGNLSVQPNDQIGRLIFQPHNGTSFVTNRLPQFRSVVDSSYTPNTANIPAGFQMIVCDNTTNYTHNFYANGNVEFASTSTVTANGGLNTAANVTANFAVITNDVNTGNVNIGNISGANVAKLIIYGDKSIFSGITLNNGQYRVINDNVNPFSGFSPLSFGSFDSSNNAIPPNRFFRARGTEASPAAVTTSDQVSATSYGVYADSGNTYLDTFYNYVFVTGNDGAGNVTANYQISSFNTGSNIVFSSSNTYASGNFTAGNLLTAGNVIADKVFSNSYIQANSYVQAVNLNANANLSVGNGAVSSIIYNTGDKTTNSFVTLNDTQFKVTMNGVNPTTGFSSFFFSVYDSTYTQVPPNYNYRARGSIASPSAVANGDEVFNNTFFVYADSGNVYKNVFNQQVVITGNDGAGNVTGNMNFTTFNTGSNINLSASNTYANNFTANNVSVNTNGFMKLSSYTAAALTAITGQVGWMAAVTNSSSGGNPNGMIAFWDTTNTRWSYIHDNSAV